MYPAFAAMVGEYTEVAVINVLDGDCHWPFANISTELYADWDANVWVAASPPVTVIVPFTDKLLPSHLRCLLSSPLTNENLGVYMELL